jgi:hypothetical protein
MSAQICRWYGMTESSETSSSSSDGGVIGFGKLVVLVHSILVFY